MICSFENICSLGATVILAARKIDNLTRTAEEIRADNPDAKVDTMLVNIRDANQCQDLTNAIVEKYGKLTCLVVNQHLFLQLIL